MTEYPFVIHSQADEAAGKAMFPDLTEEPVALEITGIGVIEGGMASGKPSMILLMADSGGQHHKVYIGCEAFLTIATGVKGAMEHFGHPWRGA
jgi:hypothetical protein